uniref:Uncharacterized protein n=1 Tax=viral metagenome TaxID=1070528 RepID=A0A6M3LNV4_9ZZZZ
MKYMDKIELVQQIGNEVCENCGSGFDCGIDLLNCIRIDNAVEMIDAYLEQEAVRASGE